MGQLFHILEGFIAQAGDLVDDRTEIESRLAEIEEIQRYAEACGEPALALSDAERISTVGLEWVSRVNDGNGEWGRFRDEARAQLDE